MASCLVTRSSVIIRFDDGHQLEIGRASTDPVAKILGAMRRLFVLDNVRIDLSTP